ncbi:MAG: N-formylglutamate amidohydrolase [Pseudomonadota bacterium]
MDIWSDNEDPDAPFHIRGSARRGRFVITCDHATNRVPAEVGDLGLPPSDMARHIAYDIGALGVARALGEALESPVVSANFSRLVIDPNRGDDDPTLVMKLYDGTIIPGNRTADVAGRIRQFYRPYDDALAAAMAARPMAALISVHSFTPQLRGRPPRPWEIGILYAGDARLSAPFIEELRRDASLTVGVNEPYVGHLPGDAVDRHALRTGRHNTLIELRQDEIADSAGQTCWAARLVEPLTRALDRALDGAGASA